MDDLCVSNLNKQRGGDAGGAGEKDNYDGVYVCLALWVCVCVSLLHRELSIWLDESVDLVAV